jgi:hypothetical protein
MMISGSAAITLHVFRVRGKIAGTIETSEKMSSDLSEGRAMFFAVGLVMLFEQFADDAGFGDAASPSLGFELGFERGRKFEGKSHGVMVIPHAAPGNT